MPARSIASLLYFSARVVPVPVLLGDRVVVAIRLQADGPGGLLTTTRGRARPRRSSSRTGENPFLAVPGRAASTDRHFHHAMVPPTTAPTPGTASSAPVVARRHSMSRVLEGAVRLFPTKSECTFADSSAAIDMSRSSLTSLTPSTTQALLPGFRRGAPVHLLLQAMKSPALRPGQVACDRRSTGFSSPG